MVEWTAEQVLQAAAAWVWVPEDAEQVRTEEYQLIRYPDRFCDPTWPPAQVAWSRATRPVDELIGEVAQCTRAWGLDEVGWWVSAATRPEGTERTLLAGGATHAESVRVLGYELARGLPALDPPAGALAELVSDEPLSRAATLVAVNGWGRPQPDEAEFATQVEQVLQDLEGWSSFKVVAFLDGRPVGTGGCTLAGEVAQLWGAVTLPAWRGRGVYRAVLAERLRLAAEHGASLALVKGRVETSAPILERAGFADYGEERRYQLAV